MDDTTAINPSPPATPTATESGSHLGAKTAGVRALAISWAATAGEKETQEPLPTGWPTVVLPRKKRPRKGVTKKIMMR